MMGMRHRRGKSVFLVGNGKSKDLFRFVTIMVFTWMQFCVFI